MHCHLLFLFRDLHYCLVLLFNGYHVCLWVCEHKWVFSVQPAVYKLLAAGTICSFLRNINAFSITSKVLNKYVRTICMLQ